jgi:hypothetical protein
VRGRPGRQYGLNVQTQGGVPERLLYCFYYETKFPDPLWTPEGALTIFAPLVLPMLEYASRLTICAILKTTLGGRDHEMVASDLRFDTR